MTRRVQVAFNRTTISNGNLLLVSLIITLLLVPGISAMFNPKESHAGTT